MHDRLPPEALAGFPAAPAPPGLLRDHRPTPVSVRVSMWLWWLGMIVWIGSVALGPRPYSGTALLGDSILTVLYGVLIIRMRRGSGTARVMLTMAGVAGIGIFATAASIVLGGRVPHGMHPIVEVPLWGGVIVSTLAALAAMLRPTRGWFR